MVAIPDLHQESPHNNACRRALPVSISCVAKLAITNRTKSYPGRITGRLNVEYGRSPLRRGWRSVGWRNRHQRGNGSGGHVGGVRRGRAPQEARGRQRDTSRLFLSARRNGAGAGSAGGCLQCAALLGAKAKPLAAASTRFGERRCLTANPEFFVANVGCASQQPHAHSASSTGSWPN